MNNIKQKIQNRIDYFNEYTDEDKQMACQYMMEDFIENAKALDMFLNGNNSTFDPNNEKHVKIWAMIDIIGDELEMILDKAK